MWTAPKMITITVSSRLDRKSTRLNSSHGYSSYAVFCLKKKNYYCLFTNQIEVDCCRTMRKFDLSVRSSRRAYFATVRHQLTILSQTDALDEGTRLSMLR